MKKKTPERNKIPSRKSTRRREGGWWQKFIHLYILRSILYIPKIRVYTAAPQKHRKPEEDGTRRSSINIRNAARGEARILAANVCYTRTRWCFLSTRNRWFLSVVYVACNIILYIFIFKRYSRMKKKKTEKLIFSLGIILSLDMIYLSISLFNLILTVCSIPICSDAETFEWI